MSKIATAKLAPSKSAAVKSAAVKIAGAKIAATRLANTRAQASRVAVKKKAVPLKSGTAARTGPAKLAVKPLAAKSLAAKTVESAKTMTAKSTITKTVIAGKTVTGKSRLSSNGRPVALKSTALKSTTPKGVVTKAAGKLKPKAELKNGVSAKNGLTKNGASKVAVATKSGVGKPAALKTGPLSASSLQANGSAASGGAKKSVPVAKSVSPLQKAVQKTSNFSAGNGFSNRTASTPMAGAALTVASQKPGMKVAIKVGGQNSPQAAKLQPDIYGGKKLALAEDMELEVVVDFKVGDKVVYPPHGVGVIEAIELRMVSNTEQKFYKVSILEPPAIFRVSLSQVRSVGLRRIVDHATVEKVYTILRDRNVVVDTQTWNRRFRDYSQRIKTGSVLEIAKVIRELAVLKGDKELSFGERRMLESAQGLLVKEISIAKASSEETIKAELMSICGFEPSVQVAV